MRLCESIPKSAITERCKGSAFQSIPCHLVRLFDGVLKVHACIEDDFNGTGIYGNPVVDNKFDYSFRIQGRGDTSGVWDVMINVSLMFC